MGQMFCWFGLPLLIVLGCPGAAAAERQHIGHNEFFYLELEDVPGGTQFSISVQTDGNEIDVFLLEASSLDDLQAGDDFIYFRPPSALSVVRHNADFSIPNTGDWRLVFDNTDAPVGGADPRGGVAIEYDLAGGGGSILSAALFETPFWQVSSALGIAGITLWMCLAAVLVKPDERRVWQWTAAVALGAFLFSFVDSLGVQVVVLVPILLGVAVGYAAAKTSGSITEGFRATYFATFVGTLVGADVMSLVLREFTVEGTLVVGGAGVSDALVVAPVSAMFWFVSSKGIASLFRTLVGRESPTGLTKGSAPPLPAEMPAPEENLEPVRASEPTPSGLPTLPWVAEHPSARATWKDVARWSILFIVGARLLFYLVEAFTQK